MAIFGTLGENNLSAISASISDTAVDVFVYDTTKDSDGGAWRKRTQNTSWYNETLNTATRGSRKEFPAVAVLVLYDGGEALRIYDGDDPDLPMWMDFTNTSGRNYFYGMGQAQCITMLNGMFMTGSQATNFWPILVDFLRDDCIGLRISGGNMWHGANIVGRNTLVSDSSAYWTEGGRRQDLWHINGYIVNQKVNDVAMTVLPNAPIDSATGLPVPTIAVATDGGPSIIKDDGNVVSYTRGGSEYTGSVAFDERNDLIISWGTSAGGYRHATRINNPFVGSTSLDSTYGYIASDTGLGGAAAGNTNGVVTVANSGRHFGIDFDSSSGVPATQGNHDDRVDFLHINDADSTKSLVAFVNSSYNTGWMHGDIKGAFLSDTDTTNITSSNLIDNGDFGTGSLTNWSTSGTTAPSISSGGALLTTGAADGAIWQSTSGEATSGKWVISWTVTSNSGGFFGLFVNNDGAGGSGGSLVYDSWTTSGSYYYEGNLTAVEFRHRGASSGIIDNINLRRVDEDRSVNNQGLAVYGTVTKSAVATGAELVAYSGFSASNILVQPYNSGFNPGTGDYSFTFWFKCSSTGAEQIYMRRFGVPTVTGGMMMRLVSSSSVLQWYVRDTSSTSTSVNSSTALDDGNWHCAVGTREGSTAKLYIDGRLDATSGCSANSHDSGTTSSLVIGAEEISSSPGTYQNPADSSSMALMRYSLSAPSAEQIKKMYEDEKVLFQENAKATLYGSSNAVTALAFDDTTELLHVGTSAGRSEFQGLRRINNTTDPVTTAISTHDSLIIEQ